MTSDEIGDVLLDAEAALKVLQVASKHQGNDQRLLLCAAERGLEKALDGVRAWKEEASQ